MKKSNIMEFIRRGLIACGFGPVVLAAVYLVLQYTGEVTVLSVNQVCTGIISLTVLSFIAGGMNIIYQIEKLPLMTAILIHGCVLYTSYLATYLINGWLKQGITPILVFSLVFIIGYFLIWVIIYSLTKRKTRLLNEMLMKKQGDGDSITE